MLSTEINPRTGEPIIRGGRSNPAYRERERMKNNARNKASRIPKPRVLKYGRSVTERERNFLKKYGISEADHVRMHVEQDGKCALCRKDIDRTAPTTHIDHDHTSGRVRGLLCNWCNIALGWYEAMSKQRLSSYLSELPDADSAAQEES